MEHFRGALPVSHQVTLDIDVISGRWSLKSEWFFECHHQLRSYRVALLGGEVRLPTGPELYAQGFGGQCEEMHAGTGSGDDSGPFLTLPCTWDQV